MSSERDVTERWRRVKSILDGALDRPPSERSAFIADASFGDQELQREVESLAALSDEDWNVFDAEQGARLASLLEDSSPRSRIGERIGSYELLSELGRGGMGAVYLARRADDEFQQRVAVKLMRPGTASEDALRRFRGERQISASLEHPNIARLLDGGATEAGEPFFVMEFVEGEPLLEHCRRHGLSIRERLDLFRRICEAVQYAHAHLVVHRDIKPENILVTAGGPKLLDFGIAKLLETGDGNGARASEQTATLLRALTPEYASPEQVRGRPVTTASDVYSLGVVLYELLAGTKPYRVESGDPAELLRVVCELDPAAPSTHAPELSGDLDAIVLKALRKEPESRYASVEQMSEDIGRHLAGVPVLARRGNAAYRAVKSVRRHRVAIAAAALVLAALGGGLIVAIREARRARSAEAQAQRRFNDVRQLANAFLNEFHDSIKNLPGSTPARRLLVQKGLAYLDNLSQEAGEDASLLRDLAAGYQRLGDLQGSPAEGSAMLGDMEGAQKSLRKSAALRERLVRSSLAVIQDRLDLAWTYSQFANTYTLDGNPHAAVEYARKAVAMLSAEEAVKRGDPRILHALGSAQFNLGSALKSADLPDEARVAFQRGLESNRRVCASDPTDDLACRGLFVGFYKIGNLELELDRFADAANAYREAARISAEFHRRDPGNGMYQRDLAFASGGLGVTLLERGDSAGAEENLQRQSELLRSLAEADPDNANPRIWLGESTRNLGNALLARGETAAARARLLESATSLESIVHRDPNDVSARTELAQTDFAMAKSYSVPGGTDAAAARSWCEKARREYLELRREGKLAPSVARLLTRVDEEIARLPNDRGRR
ncbi:MAG TPA: serine/threonine-protein kinase [Thermoanaerobaculia bacterium]|jgi:non-specific serine/threonine protein kinase/serine/threonine-protein kinase